VPLALSRNNRLTNMEMLTAVQLRTGVPLAFIMPASRCAPTCTEYGPNVRFTVSGIIGTNRITVEWHRAGCHQLSCKLGKRLELDRQSRTPRCARRPCS
jgi:hypothetical protein